MNIADAIAKARRRLERIASEAEARNIAAWRERGHSAAEITGFLAACREHNVEAIDEALEDLRTELEHWVRHPDANTVH